MSVIVIVDDRVTNRNIFAKLAASIEAGIVVRTFGDPVEALGWLAGNTPDLIITDYKMPHLDGAEFIRRFREIPKAVDIPVVVITVYEERSFRLRALEAGATDFLHSPVDHHEFVTRARNLLKLRHQQILLESRASSLEKKLEHSERTRATAMRDSREQLAQVIDTVPVMISAANAEGRVLFANRQQAAFAGIDVAAITGAPLAELFGAEHGARNRSLDRVVLETAKALPPFEEEIVGRDGEARVFLTTKSPLRDAADVVTGVLTSSLDISDRKKIEAHLRHLAHHDPLTDLPNRTLLRDRLRRMIVRARRGDQQFALHMIDLDGFKSVNDLLGHAAGDRFIQLVSSRLADTIREHDTLARIGGDEFAILQTSVTNSEDAAEFARRILETVSECSGFEGAPLRAAASVGVAMHPADGLTPSTLIHTAVFAMYRAKAGRGDSFCFYEADTHARARRDMALDSDLRRALERGEFVLYYQPQIDLSTGAIFGAEALLRWNKPGEGVVAPGAFLGRAEENGLIVPINEWVLREACREAKGWRDASGEPLCVSVNMSPIQFQKHNAPLLVARILGETGLDPRRLDIEITEGIVVTDFDAVASDLRRLLDLGVRISIDDFGTGYSSLTYASRLPVSRLKIDQSFVRNFRPESHDEAIIRTIVTLARSLDLRVIAEGVETVAQMEFLRSEGCDEAQGYYFGRPMPAENFRQLIQTGVSVERSPRRASA